MDQKKKGMEKNKMADLKEKEIEETISPKDITIDFLKNQLANYESALLRAKMLKRTASVCKVRKQRKEIIKYSKHAMKHLKAVLEITENWN